jgi:hypothetical protein
MDLAFTELDAHLKMYTNYKPIFLNYIRVIPGLDESSLSAFVTVKVRLTAPQIKISWTIRKPWHSSMAWPI